MTNEEVLIKHLTESKDMALCIDDRDLGVKIRDRIEQIIKTIKGCDDDKLTEHQRFLINSAMAIAGSKAELSFQLGISPQTLMAWHRGINKPRSCMVLILENYIAGKRKGNRKEHHNV